MKYYQAIISYIYIGIISFLGYILIGCYTHLGIMTSHKDPGSWSVVGSTLPLLCIGFPSKRESSKTQKIWSLGWYQCICKYMCGMVTGISIRQQQVENRTYNMIYLFIWYRHHISCALLNIISIYLIHDSQNYSHTRNAHTLTHTFSPWILPTRLGWQVNRHPDP